MQLTSGINHLAIVTPDLDRFIQFYRSVFDLEVAFIESNPQFRHALLRTGSDSWLHPLEFLSPMDAARTQTAPVRRPVDHIALTAASSDAFEEIRSRLIRLDACDGTVNDLGSFHSFMFSDPDGLQCEVVWVVDKALQRVHAPRPRTDATKENAASH